MIGVLDYGLGNIVAVRNLLLKSGIKHSILSTPIEKSNFYSSLILPGVGSFDAGIKLLKSTCFYEYIIHIFVWLVLILLAHFILIDFAYSIINLEFKHWDQFFHFLIN